MQVSTNLTICDRRAGGHRSSPQNRLYEQTLPAESLHVLLQTRQRPCIQELVQPGQRPDAIARCTVYADQAAMRAMGPWPLGWAQAWSVPVREGRANTPTLIQYFTCART